MQYDTDNREYFYILKILILTLLINYKIVMISKIVQVSLRNVIGQFSTIKPENSYSKVSKIFTKCDNLRFEDDNHSLIMYFFMPNILKGKS